MKDKYQNPSSPNPKIGNDKSYSSDPGNTPYNSVEADDEIESQDNLEETQHDTGLNEKDHLDETTGSEFDIY